MEENADFSELDSFMINNLINILNQNFNGKQSKRSLSKIQIINYIFENGDLPLKCRIGMIVDIFILEYFETDKTESNITNLKDKWVNIILTHCEFALNAKGRIYEHLENRIINSNKIGIEVQKQRLLKQRHLKLNLHTFLDADVFSKTPKFNILIECISDFNPKLALNILAKIAMNLYFLCFERGIKDCAINEILDSQKGVYHKKFGLIPRINDFVAYLINYGINPFNLPETTIEELLAEHVIDKLEIIDINIEKAKNKQQTSIDITPHQTISIETTTDNAEEGKIILTKTGEKFSLPQIALIYYYDGLALNGNNCNDIILTYGWNSGKKLLEWHTKFDTGNSIRLYSHSSGKRIYSVLEYLTTEKGKTDAKKDLKDIGFDFE